VESNAELNKATIPPLLIPQLSAVAPHHLAAYTPASADSCQQSGLVYSVAYKAGVFGNSAA
jgi:hypothetical protein